MHPVDDLLLAAVRAVPRRHRLPPLPADAAAAQAAGCETALAWAIEQARLAKEQQATAPHEAMPARAAEARGVFLAALAQFIGQALAAQGGDPAFQALVLRAREPTVQEYLRLAEPANADRRAVRAAVDAMAHPGKLRSLPATRWTGQLARLHALASAGAWRELRNAAGELLAHAGPELEPVRATLETLCRSEPLQRLERAGALQHEAAVRAYRALGARQGPLAGSSAASAHGRAAARAGEAAEARTVAAFERMAQLLARRAPEAGYRAVRSLRTPPGFPGDRHKAKDEWDAAIVRDDAIDGRVRIVLLAEVKVSPAAALPDLARLLRGLRRLAGADDGAVYAFASADGPVHIAGASLRSLHPAGHAPPPCVIYCCPSPPEPRPQFLAASSKAVLAAEPASIAYALRLTGGERPDDEALAPVWDALLAAPRLRATLHQDASARTVRNAMVDPDELLQELLRAQPPPR